MAHWTKNFKKSPAYKRTSQDGKTFHSASECKRYEELTYMQRLKQVDGLRTQVPFDLILPDGTPIKTPTGRTMKYVADYVYKIFQYGVWVEVVEDHKGFYSAESKLKIAVFEAIYKIKVNIHKAKKYQ